MLLFFFFSKYSSRCLSSFPDPDLFLVGRRSSCAWMCRNKTLFRPPPVYRISTEAGVFFALCDQFVFLESRQGLLGFCWLVINNPFGCYLRGEIHANIIHDRGEAVCSISATSIFNDVDFSGGEENKSGHSEDGVQCRVRPAGDSSSIFKMQTYTVHVHTWAHRDTQKEENQILNILTSCKWYSPALAHFHPYTNRTD